MGEKIYKIMIYFLNENAFFNLINMGLKKVKKIFQ
jgi:hypothetical protein